MPGAKMRLVDNNSQILFAVAKKNSIFDEQFVVATISKIRNLIKHLIKHKPQTLPKLDDILKFNSPLQNLNRSFALHLPNFIHDT